MCPIFSRLNKLFPTSAFLDYFATKTECEKTAAKQLNDKESLKKSQFPLKLKDPHKEWETLDFIGDGAFAQVFKVRNYETGQIAAMKMIYATESLNLDELIIEIQILKMCKHKNITRLYDAYVYESKIYMILEYCSLGSLSDIMNHIERSLTEDEIKYIVKQLLEALDFLHQNVFVIHRDIKAANILVNESGELKLADFGVSAKNWYLEQKKTTFAGSPYWISPEVVSCNTQKFRTYNYKVDIWSLGITCIELAEKQPPNTSLRPKDAMKKILSDDSLGLKEPTKWSEEFRNFISICLTRCPNDRPDAFKLLEHPFINNADKITKPKFVKECYRSMRVSNNRETSKEEWEFNSSFSSGYSTDSVQSIASLLQKTTKALPKLPPRSFNVKKEKLDSNYTNVQTF